MSPVRSSLPKSAVGRAAPTLESSIQVIPSNRSSLIRSEAAETSNIVKRTVERYRKAVEDIEARRGSSNNGAVSVVLHPKPRLFATESDSPASPQSSASSLSSSESVGSSGDKVKKNKSKKKKKKKRKDAGGSSTSSDAKPRKASNESRRSSGEGSSTVRRKKKDAKARTVSGITSALDAAVSGVSVLGPADFEVGLNLDDEAASDSQPKARASLDSQDGAAVERKERINRTKTKTNKSKKKAKRKRNSAVAAPATPVAKEEEEEPVMIETVSNTDAELDSELVKDETADAPVLVEKKKKKKKKSTKTNKKERTKSDKNKSENKMKSESKMKSENKSSSHRRSSSLSSTSSTTPPSRTVSLESIDASPVEAASLSNGWDDPMLDQGFDLAMISPGFTQPKALTPPKIVDTSDPNRKLSVVELRELRRSAVLSEVRCYWDEWWMWYSDIQNPALLEEVDVPMSVCAMTTSNTALLELDDDLNPTHPIHSSNIKKDSITQLRARLESGLDGAKEGEESEEELSIFDLHMMGASTMSMSSMCSLLGGQRAKPGLFGIDTEKLELSPTPALFESDLEKKESGFSLASSGAESTKSTTSILASPGCRGRNKSVHWPELNRLFEFASDEDLMYYDDEEGEEAQEGEDVQDEVDQRSVTFQVNDQQSDDGEVDGDDLSYHIMQNGNTSTKEADFGVRYLTGTVTHDQDEGDLDDDNSSIVWGNASEEEEDESQSSQGGSAHFVDLGFTPPSSSSPLASSNAVQANSHFDDDDYPELEPWGAGLDDTVADVGRRVSSDERGMPSARMNKGVMKDVDDVSSLMTSHGTQGNKKVKKRKGDGSALRSWAATKKNGKGRTRNMFGSIVTNEAFKRALKEQGNAGTSARYKKKNSFEASNPMAPMPMPRGSGDILERARRSRLAERKRSKNARRADSFADAITKLQEPVVIKRQNPKLHKAKRSMRRAFNRVTHKVGLVRPSRGSLVET